MQSPDQLSGGVPWQPRARTSAKKTATKSATKKPATTKPAGKAKPAAKAKKPAWGLFLFSDGERDEEVEDAWTSLGALDVGAGGVVVLDATERGKEKGSHRSAVALPSGRYDVLARTPQGFGGDLTAVRIVRQES